MAKSRFEYVKGFENDPNLLPSCYIVIRLDGRFTKDHEYSKPNDVRGLDLMNRCALETFSMFPDVVLAFGHSDEYSFVLRRDTDLYHRRLRYVSKVILFVDKAHNYFPSTAMRYPPNFDGRVVLYPTDETLRDYLCWRQSDCHINNLYNTIFWCLVLRDSKSERDAHEALKGTTSSDKQEMLFSRFSVNYNGEDAHFRKGSVVVRKETLEDVKTPSGASSTRKRRKAVVCHDDVISDRFWREGPGQDVLR